MIKVQLVLIYSNKLNFTLIYIVVNRVSNILSEGKFIIFKINSIYFVSMLNF